MSNTISTALSRQSALTKELNSIANNIANADTIGFRASRPFYSEFVQSIGPQNDGLSQTRVAGRVLNQENGALTRTGGSLDVAIEGDGYFVVETPNGQRLTRAGSFTLDPQGNLTTISGHPVADASGAPIAIPTDANNIIIAPDGAIAADGAPVGQLAVVSAPPTSLERAGDNLLRSTGVTTPIVNPGVRQGFVEESNVSTVLELSRMIEVQRAFELNQQLIVDEHDRISQTIDGFARQ